MCPKTVGGNQIYSGQHPYLEGRCRAAHKTGRSCGRRRCSADVRYDLSGSSGSCGGSGRSGRAPSESSERRRSESRRKSVGRRADSRFRLRGVKERKW